MHTGAGFRAVPGVPRLMGLAIVVAAAVTHGDWRWSRVSAVAGIAVAAFALDAAARHWAPPVLGAVVLGEGVAATAIAFAPTLAGVATVLYLCVPPLTAAVSPGRRWALVVVGAQLTLLFTALWWSSVGELLRRPWAPVALGSALLVAVIAAVVGGAVGTKAVTAASTAATAAAEERRRLGRELHDRVAQDLAGLALRVDGLAVSVPGVVSARVVSELGSEARRILREVRRCITDLRADGLADVSLATAMTDHARQAADAVGITAHLSLSEASRRLEARTELELLRISQEAINNVRRHASARNLWVDLRIDPPSATLCVADDGIGPPRFAGGSPPGTGHGLSIMRERAQAIGAAIAVTGRPGGGTQVDVSISAPNMARRVGRQMGDGP